MSGYHVPAETARAETEVSRSRFIATAGNAETVEAARAFIAAIRAEMPDASHHVYAFKVGYGASVQEGMSDDGEPTGTSGPPILELLRGADLGDVVMVVTRYFGGTKLGTGGLVRAYREAARAALTLCTLREKLELKQLELTLPYALYEQVKRLMTGHHATIDREAFGAEIILVCTLPLTEVDALTVALRNLSAGRIIPNPIG
jgi:uncharacterized YigZ family protein